MNLDPEKGMDRGAEPWLPPMLTPGFANAAPVHSYFKREVGSLARAQLHFGQYSQLPRPTSQAAQRGVRYEKKVLRLLTRRFGDRLLAGPLFTFAQSAPPGWVCRIGRAYPDALLFDEEWKSLCIVEVKFRHTGDAWHQLGFYKRIVRKALPMFRVCVLEVCASYDPSQRLPQAVAFVNEVNEAFETREVFHPLHVLTERELKNDGNLA